jgi:hypothetical protein
MKPTQNILSVPHRAGTDLFEAFPDFLLRASVAL